MLWVLMRSEGLLTSTQNMFSSRNKKNNLDTSKLKLKFLICPQEMGQSGHGISTALLAN